MNLDYILKAKGAEMRKEDNKSYYYASTRARAMIARLLSELDYEKMLKIDINEMIRFLGEREYKKEIEKFGIKATKLEPLEFVLNENFANSVNGLLKFTPPHCPLWAYIMKYDIANIKAVIRNKESKGKREDLLRALVFVGSFNTEFSKKLVNLDTKAAVIEALRGTPYYNVLKKSEGKPFEEAEDNLDRFYYDAVMGVAANHKTFYNLVRAEIDIRNILTLLRLKRAKIHEIGKFLIGGGFINIRKLSEISRLDEFEIINNLKNYRFWKFAPTNTKELDKIEVGLRKYLFAYAFFLQSKFSTFEPLLGYLVGKEREIINIRILARSKIVKHAEDALSIRSKLFVK